MRLLAPLSEATEMLCTSKYPSLNNALPVYMVLMKQLKQVQRGLYDQAQFIQPATQIIEKIKQYLIDALKKNRVYYRNDTQPNYQNQVLEKVQSLYH